MNFWDTLEQELKRIGFSTVQINRLRDQFGTLDAAELLNTPEQEIFPYMTGRTVREKRDKIATLLAVVEEIQVRMDRQIRRDEFVTIVGELKGLPQDVFWQGLTIGIIDLKRAPQQIQWQAAVEEGGNFTFQVPKRDWRRLSPGIEPRFRFRLLWHNRNIYSTREPIAITAGPGASPVEIDVPRVAITRLQATATPQQLRSELNVDAIATAARAPATVQAQLRQASIQSFDDLFSRDGRAKLKDLDLDQTQTRRLYTTARWAAQSGDVRPGEHHRCGRH